MKKLVLLTIMVMFCFGCNKKTYVMELELTADTNDDYEWSYSLSNENILKNTLNNYVSDEPTIDSNELYGMQYYKFESNTPGETKLVFTYSNSKKAIYTIDYDIVVNKNMSIVVNETKSNSSNIEVPTPNIYVK